VRCHQWVVAFSKVLTDLPLGAQYSAASFIETINSGSLSMDPDEFVARMVAAGVADMPPPSPRGAANDAAAATAGISKPVSPPAFATSFSDEIGAAPPPAPLQQPPPLSAGARDAARGCSIFKKYCICRLTARIQFVPSILPADLGACRTAAGWQRLAV